MHTLHSWLLRQHFRCFHMFSVFGWLVLKHLSINSLHQLFFWTSYLFCRGYLLQSMC